MLNSVFWPASSARGEALAKSEAKHLCIRLGSAAAFLTIAYGLGYAAWFSYHFLTAQEWGLGSKFTEINQRATELRLYLSSPAIGISFAAFLFRNSLQAMGDAQAGFFASAKAHLSALEMAFAFYVLGSAIFLGSVTVLAVFYDLRNLDLAATFFMLSGLFIPMLLKIVPAPNSSSVSNVLDLALSHCYWPTGRTAESAMQIPILRRVYGLPANPN